MESNEASKQSSRSSLMSLRSQNSGANTFGALKNVFQNLGRPGGLGNLPIRSAKLSKIEQLKKLLVDFENPEQTYLAGVTSKVTAFQFQEKDKSLYLGFNNGEVVITRSPESC